MPPSRWHSTQSKIAQCQTKQCITSPLTCVTFSVTLWVLSLTFGAIMAFSDVGGEWVFLSVPSEKLSAIRGILLMVLYLLMLESEVEPSKLDFTWLKGPGGLEQTAHTLLLWCRLHILVKSIIWHSISNLSICGVKIQQHNTSCHYLMFLKMTSQFVNVVVSRE